ncbi:MAG: UDP-N-acetylmuramate dehydrogenase [Candidatus Krumholzibacteriia bacterium]
MPAFDALISALPGEFRDAVRRGTPLEGLTTLRVGGPADLVCSIRTPEAALRFQALAAEARIPAYVLGAGSNVLAADPGYRGVILRVETADFAAAGDVVTAGAGLGFDDLIVRSLDAGLVGLEFASGIPGTLGGALVGNAGCYGHEIGEFLLDAVVLRPDGRLETVGPEAFGFRYRETDLRETGAMVLGARFKLRRGDVHEAGRLRQEKLADRRRKHPVDTPSAGSWFRNLPPAGPGGRRRPAGELLERAGAKDMCEGPARVFPLHANIIINAGGATSAQISRLADRMRAAVRERFAVDLQEEVRRLGS